MGVAIGPAYYDPGAAAASKAAADAEAAAQAQAAVDATAATKAANEARWTTNHPTRYAFAGDTIMTLGTESIYAKKKLLGE